MENCPLNQQRNGTASLFVLPHGLGMPGGMFTILNYTVVVLTWRAGVDGPPIMVAAFPAIGLLGEKFQFNRLRHF